MILMIGASKLSAVKMSFLIYLRIICNQILMQITDVWYFSLPAKKMD